MVQQRRQQLGPCELGEYLAARLALHRGIAASPRTSGRFVPVPGWPRDDPSVPLSQTRSRSITVHRALPQGPHTPFVPASAAKPNCPTVARLANHTQDAPSSPLHLSTSPPTPSAASPRLIAAHRRQKTACATYVCCPVLCRLSRTLALLLHPHPGALAASGARVATGTSGTRRLYLAAATARCPPCDPATQTVSMRSLCSCTEPAAAPFRQRPTTPRASTLP